jgi:hypothetical protein
LWSISTKYMSENSINKMNILASSIDQCDYMDLWRDMCVAMFLHSDEPNGQERASSWAILQYQ